MNLSRERPQAKKKGVKAKPGRPHPGVGTRDWDCEARDGVEPAWMSPTFQNFQPASSWPVLVVIGQGPGSPRSLSFPYHH